MELNQGSSFHSWILGITPECPSLACYHPSSALDPCHTPARSSPGDHCMVTIAAGPVSIQYLAFILVFMPVPMPSSADTVSTTIADPRGREHSGKSSKQKIVAPGYRTLGVRDHAKWPTVFTFMSALDFGTKLSKVTKGGRGEDHQFPQKGISECKCYSRGERQDFPAGKAGLTRKTCLKNHTECLTIKRGRQGTDQRQTPPSGCLRLPSMINPSGRWRVL